MGIAKPSLQSGCLLQEADAGGAAWVDLDWQLSCNGLYPAPPPPQTNVQISYGVSTSFLLLRLRAVRSPDTQLPWSCAGLAFFL